MVTSVASLAREIDNLESSQAILPDFANRSDLNSAWRTKIRMVETLGNKLFGRDGWIKVKMPTSFVSLKRQVDNLQNSQDTLPNFVHRNELKSQWRSKINMVETLGGKLLGARGWDIFIREKAFTHDWNQLDPKNQSSILHRLSASSIAHKNQPRNPKSSLKQRIRVVKKVCALAAGSGNVENTEDFIIRRLVRPR